MKVRFLIAVLATASAVPAVLAQDVRTNTPPAAAQGAAVVPVVTSSDGRSSTPSKEQTSRTRRTGRVTWVTDMLPAVILANIAADEFYVESPGNGREELSLISSVPVITLGADIACLDGYLNLRLGAGMLLNASLGTWLATGQAGYSLEVQRNVMFGPHIGLSYYAAPEWWGDADVTFDDTMGFLLGLHVAAGDRIAYLFSVDYMAISFDVDRTGEGVHASKKELDMSGLAVQFGLRVQF